MVALAVGFTAAAVIDARASAVGDSLVPSPASVVADAGTVADADRRAPRQRHSPATMPAFKDRMDVFRPIPHE